MKQLDYSDVYMVGTSWRVRGSDEVFATAFEAAGGVVEDDDNAPDLDDESGDDIDLFDVFKVVDGERAKNASKHNVSKEDADAFVAKNPDTEYEIVADEK